MQCTRDICPLCRQCITSLYTIKEIKSETNTVELVQTY